MREATVIFLICAFTVKMGGYVNVYHFMYEKKSEARSGYLKQQDTFCVATSRGLSELAERGFKKVEEGEYKFRGRLYDVLRQQQKGGSILVYLAHDSYEEKLLAFLKSFLSPAPNRSQNQTTAMLKHDLLKQYLPTLAHASATFVRMKNVALSPVLRSPDAPYLEITLPPPQPAA